MKTLHLRHSGISLVIAIVALFDFTPIVRTLRREGWAGSKDEADQQIQAFLQWFALVVGTDPKRPYVMMRGPVDHVFHAFVLNTEFYAKFCSQVFGKFINHNPLDGDLADTVATRGGLEYTVGHLVENYGTQLHPLLVEWVEGIRAGTLTASSLSCVGGCYEIPDVLAISRVA